MKIIKSLVLFSMLCHAAQVFAFDDNREGFILGLGAGLHGIKNDYRLNDIGYLTESSSGLASSFKIGGGLGDQFALYFVHNASRFRAPVSTGTTSREATAVLFVDGIGVSYFFQHSTPSAYIHAGLGASVYTFPMESDTPYRRGGAMMLGGGYEFAQHLLFDVTLLASRTSVSANSPEKIHSSVMQFTLNYLFY